MSTPWIAVFVALSAVTAALAIIVAGILPQAVAAMGAAPTAAQPVGGLVEAEPMGYDLVGRTIDPPPGTTWTALGRRTVVYLEVGCEGCHLLAADAVRNRRLARASGQTLLFIVDRLDGPFTRLPDVVHTIEDTGGAIARSWDIRASPIAYHVTHTGFVMGATHPSTLRAALALRGRVNDSTGGVAGTQPVPEISPAASAPHNHHH